MSKLPYVIQQDRPNLVIVPTVTCYKPSPEKTKLDNNSSSTNVPEIVKISEKSALVDNAGVKVKPRVSSVNENVLIDVTKVKRQPNSWATNFLQSIGGTTSKLPRVYNWHSSASKLASLRNENIQPINYLPIACSEMYINTTQSNANKETIQPKSNKEVASSKTNINASQPKPNNHSALSNGTNVTTKSKTQCSQPELNKEAHQSIDSKARFLPTVNKYSSHTKPYKEATPKAEKDATQPKPTKEAIYPKSKNELTHDTKKACQTKTILKKKCQNESTKLSGKSDTSRTKVHDKASSSSDKNVHKENFKSKILKEIPEKKPSKTQKSETNRENIPRKKIKVDGKISRESGSDKNKQSKEINSRKIKRDSSKSRKSTSPIKSVVNKIKNHTSDDSKHTNKYEMNHNSNHLEKKTNDSVDLRAKLKRRAPKNDITKEYEIKEKRKCKNIFPTMPKGKGFVPNENLIISFDTENNTEEVIEEIKPVKSKTRKHQSGGNKCKKIKLEINILFQKDDTTDDESSKCGDKEDYENYSDLSFLDDFNVDEIVESLNDCQSNIVKIDNSVNSKDNKRPPKIDVDLPTLTDKNTMINNYECLSKGEKVIENNTTNVSSLTLCNEKSNIKTENKAIELVIKVESFTDHNTFAENNNGTSELKSKNMLETPREGRSVNGKADKSSNAVGEIKTEFVENYINENIICAECSTDLSATNSNNMKKLSKSVTLPGDGKSKNDNILYTEIKSEEVHNSKSTQLDTKNTNKLQKENTETDKTTNIDLDDCKLVEKLATDENGTLASDVKNKSKAMSENNHTATANLIKVETDKASIFVDNNKHEDEVILIEDSDNDCDNDMAKVQGTQSLVKHEIIDLTFQKDSSFYTKPKEMLNVDAVELKTNETGSEPILILDTDYDDLKDNDDLKNEKGIMKINENHAPIDITKKNLFCNSSNKIHASDTMFNHKPDSETKNKQYKGKEPVTLGTNTCQNKSDDVKIENANVKNIIPSVDDKKDAATNKGTVTDLITAIDTKQCAKASQDRTQTKTQSQKELNDDKTSAIVREQILCIKETHDNKIKMRVDKSDTTTLNTVTQNQQKSNTQEHKHVNLNEVKSSITNKQLLHINENDDINITMWLENKISQDMKKKAKTTQKDGKLKDEEKCASTGNRTSTVDENHDGHIRMWVVNKGDTRTNTVVQNQQKINPEDTKDGKPKPVDNMTDNITPNVNAKCQPNQSNKTSTQAASIVNKNTPATEKQDSKTNLVKGDPRTRQNQPKTNLQDKKDVKSKTVDNLNSQNVNEKIQPKAPNKCSPQTKGNNFGSIQADKNSVHTNFYARRLEYRMRQYFGAKCWVAELIHSGRFSTIYRCKDGKGDIKTVKQIKEAWQIGAHKEGMMMKLQYGVPESNYNCVLYEHGFSVAGQWCYVMEYYPKSLQEAMNINNKSFHIDKVQEFSRQLVAAVTVLRNNNIIHSDINPSHILMNDSETRIKLCGFDQAFFYNGGDMLPNVGTVNYRAPELILGYQADYGIDVWATALVMYEMASNRQLFPGFFNNDILYKQFCTLDKFPYNMLERCYYRDQHFMGDAFVRIVGSRGEGKLLVREFYKKERIHSVLLKVYHNQWAKIGTNRIEDKGKLNALCKLLKKMLTMDPNGRIAIEFVFADPFIYESL